MANLDALIAQIRGLSDDQWGTLHATLLVEEERRRAAPLVEQGQAEVVEGLVDAGVVTGPDAGTTDTPVEDLPAWVDPGIIHTSMYLRGAVITHKGRVWESTHPGLNHWEPGTPGVDGRIWLDVTPAPIDEETGEEQIIAWGVGQAVEVGDLRTHDGQTWECLLAHTTHEGWVPSPEAHTVWKLVT